LVDVVVADAGPLIGLSRVVSLSVLPAVFARTLITRTVTSQSASLKMHCG
jgi:predicted nucleic acid-binding protein